MCRCVLLCTAKYCCNLCMAFAIMPNTFWIICNDFSIKCEFQNLSDTIYTHIFSGHKSVFAYTSTFYNPSMLELVRCSKLESCLTTHIFNIWNKKRTFKIKCNELVEKQSKRSTRILTRVRCSMQNYQSKYWNLFVVCEKKKY